MMKNRQVIVTVLLQIHCSAPECKNLKIGQHLAMFLTYSGQYTVVCATVTQKTEYWPLCVENIAKCSILTPQLSPQPTF